ncbi:glucosamine 6-phosphate synthetase [Alphaproteobacteria bacterium]|nr:glucosamine 6-phosphate synthetase [Alphaproteobacteria bacterium]
MCGIFGIIAKSNTTIDRKDALSLISAARQRGKDSSGFLYESSKENSINASRADFDIAELFQKMNVKETNILFGHSRLITNSDIDNQPVIQNDIAVLHNGIIVNTNEIWKSLDVKPKLKIDSEALIGLTNFYLKNNPKKELQELCDFILENCKGVVATAIFLGQKGKLLLLSNNGSLYTGSNDNGFYFSSESYPLKNIGCSDIKQIRAKAKIIDIKSFQNIDVKNYSINRRSLVLKLGSSKSQDQLLPYKKHEFVRCTRCILPETMPFIEFDQNGVCNYCNNYTQRNKPKPMAELEKKLSKYRRNNSADCIVPFSGGRDSCYGLHLIKNELGMNPITYTYDWGMVTDLGRRNISRMSSQLGVENIIFAADVAKKRQNIKKNLIAWLQSPDLGMVSILTAGDKHFFKYVESVKKQTNISLNLWGINPLEVTHFKSGFLGIPPDFHEKHVYSHGALKQLNYQWLRLCAMTKSVGYFNSSIWDTITGEYYRSFTKKNDYFHIFDYWRWDEKEIDKVLEQYDWEKAPDTNTTWRIGDGTAAFYNYVYYTVAGFTEHDTFRSNQIREGDLTREKALTLVEDENKPRYPNIKWYLDAVGLEFDNTISKINQIPRIF